MKDLELINKFDSELSNFLSQKSYICQRIFNINRTKQSLTLLVRRADGSQAYVLKWRRKDAPEKTRRWFSNELAFLEAHQDLRVAPRLAAGDPFHLLLEHFEGQTLREWLTAYLNLHPTDTPAADFQRLSKNLFEGVNLLARHTARSQKTGQTAELFTEKFMTIFDGLCLSGPMGTQRTRLEWAICKALNLLSRQRVQAFAWRWFSTLEQPLLRGWTHGDLHLNNIIVNDDAQMQFVDFATAEPEGFVLLDLLYLTAAFNALLLERPAHKRLIADLAENSLDKILVAELRRAEQLQELLRLAAGINSRFRHKAAAVQLLLAHKSFIPKVLKLTKD